MAPQSESTATPQSASNARRANLDQLDQRFVALTAALRQLLARCARAGFEESGEEFAQVQTCLEPLALLRARFVDHCHAQLSPGRTAATQVPRLLALIKAMSFQDELSASCTRLAHALAGQHPRQWPVQLRERLSALSSIVHEQLALIPAQSSVRARVQLDALHALTRRADRLYGRAHELICALIGQGKLDLPLFAAANLLVEELGNAADTSRLIVERYFVAQLGSAPAQ